MSVEAQLQEAIDSLDQRSVLFFMALLGKRATDILQVHEELEGKTSGSMRVLKKK